MGRGKPVVTATRSFDCQSRAIAFFKDMLNRYRKGDRVSDDDSLDLAALLARHDRCAQKIGCGVDHFEVMEIEYGTNCFRIVRHDGTGTDFSYRHCIIQRRPTRKQEVSRAFRRAVQFDLYAARDRFFAQSKGSDERVTCAVTGARIGQDEAHMDHRPPMTFEVIVTTFLAGRGLNPDQVPVTSGRDNQISSEIADAGLAEAFRTYHAQVAKLDIVKNSVNLSQSARHRIKDSRISLAK